MKKLSEVCRIAGVTRRTLQEYDKIGLLEHTAETESGYWLYDDSALDKLYFILLFVEAGYKRLKIKEILSRPQMNLDAELRVAVEALKQKRERIDGLINFIDITILSVHREDSEISKKVAEIEDGIDVSSLFPTMSYKDAFEYSIRYAAHLPEGVTLDDIKEWMPVNRLLYALAILSNKGTESIEVQNCVKNLCEVFIELMKQSEGEDVVEGYSEEEILIGTCKALEELLEDAELNELDIACGKGSAEFVRRAVETFRLRLIEGKVEE